MAVNANTQTLEQAVSAFKGFSATDGVIDTPPAADAAQDAATQTAQPADETPHDDAATPQDDSAGDSVPASEPDDSSESAAADSGAAQTPKPKQTAQDRINDLTRARRSAERALEDERRVHAAQLESINARIAAMEKGGLTNTKNDVQSDNTEAPDPSKFTYGELDAGYIRAVARHEAKQESVRLQAVMKEQQEEAARRQEAQTLTQKLSEFEKKGADKYGDFSDKVVDGARSGEWQLSPSLGQLVLNSPAGVDIAYHLANNPGLSREIFNKSPLEQAVQFGRLEAQFSPGSQGAAGGKPVKATNAPSPPAYSSRGAGGGGQTITSLAGGTDFRAFEAAMRKRK